MHACVRMHIYVCVCVLKEAGLHICTGHCAQAQISIGIKMKETMWFWLINCCFSSFFPLWWVLTVFQESPGLLDKGESMVV